MIDVAVRRLATGRRCSRARRTRATPASTSPPASAVVLEPGSGRSCRPGSRSRSRRATRASSSRARDSRRATGSAIVNSPGLIDSGYRGEIRVVLLNTGREPFSVEAGMRIAQLVVAPVASVRLVEVDELAASERGARGFGSSTS